VTLEMDSARTLVPSLTKSGLDSSLFVPAANTTQDDASAEEAEKDTKELARPPSTTNDSDLIDLSDFDAVLAAKLKLCNDAQDHMGWTSYHTRLFIICGFGYSVDSALIFLPSALYTNVSREYQPQGFPRWTTIGIYIGLFIGALLFGLGTDAKGRKYIFNISLFCCAIFTILAGAAPNYVVLVIFTGLACVGGGGNLCVRLSVVAMR
jgi:hypothetical protein